MITLICFLQFAAVESLYSTIQRLKGDGTDTKDGTELAKFLASAKDETASGLADEVFFTGVKMSDAIATVFQAFRRKYVDSLSQSLQGRFDDFQQQDTYVQRSKAIRYQNLANRVRGTEIIWKEGNLLAN